MLTAESLRISSLGPCEIPSPLGLSRVLGDQIADYTSDRHRVRVISEFDADLPPTSDPSFEKAGPREAIFFDPQQTRAAFVSCGGLCPGTNSVLRSAVLELFYKYGVRDILGYRYGYHGLRADPSVPPMVLSPEVVLHIHRRGGSLLGMARGAEPVPSMVDTLVRDRVNILFCIGGDGTLRGAHAIATEIARRGLPIAVVGIPKTIDNDVAWVDKTFGYDTAVEVAKEAIDAAHNEATSAFNGVGLVKLMGRDAGFIAAGAVLASREANFCLIPEVAWRLDGEHGLLAALERRLAARPHAVIVVAEGCGARLAHPDSAHDESGNLRYSDAASDIGPFLRDAIAAHCKARNLPLTLKYIDPSYMIRSVPANASDNIFCDMLARCAVHAGMAGKTDLVIGHWNGSFTHVPIALATSARKQVDTDGALWLAVSEATGQSF